MTAEGQAPSAPQGRVQLRQKVHVFPADAFRVASGANLGDPLRGPEDTAMGDVYRLRSGVIPLRLVLEQGKVGNFIMDGSQAGQPGDRVRQCARYLLMAPDGDLVELLLLAHEPGGQLFALPTSPIGSQIEYTLLDIDSAPEPVTLADVMCVSFAAGTMITLASGMQRPVEQLQIGDSVLTRDRGAQEVRWIGHLRRRALGVNAPVVVVSGTLGNNADLIVSPNHRLFLYQRPEERLGPTAELLIPAKHLIDGSRVFRREGGWIDYYAVVFDHHEVIYAEGIPTESLQVNEATLNVISDSLASDLRLRFPGLTQRAHVGTEPVNLAPDLRDALLRERGREPLDDAAS